MVGLDVSSPLKQAKFSLMTKKLSIIQQLTYVASNNDEDDLDDLHDFDYDFEFPSMRKGPVTTSTLESSTQRRDLVQKQNDFLFFLFIFFYIRQNKNYMNTLK